MDINSVIIADDVFKYVFRFLFKAHKGATIQDLQTISVFYKVGVVIGEEVE